MLLLLLSHFSRVQLCVTPPGSAILGILQTRTLEWVAISFSNAWKWKVKVKLLSRVWLIGTPMDCSLPGSTIHGIFQARVQEWGAIAFSDNEKRTRQNLKSPPALTISIRFKIKSMCIDLKVCLQHTCFTEQVINTADVLPLKYFGSKVICSMFISALTQWFSDQILTSKSYSNNQC